MTLVELAAAALGGAIGGLAWFAAMRLWEAHHG